MTISHEIHSIALSTRINSEYGTARPSAVAEFGLHGAYLLGPRQSIRRGDEARWLGPLASFIIGLARRVRVR